jgi:hypothetical protein
MSTRARQFADSVSNLIEIASGDSTDFITPEILSASIAGIQEDINNIDLSSAIVSASSAAVAELNNRIFISSASPTLGNNDGKMWVDVTTASAPVISVYNSTINNWEKPYLGVFNAYGGNITYSNGYKIHAFTGAASFIVEGSRIVEFLVVAGGAGGGAGYYAGGGGSGGVLSGTTLCTSGSYEIQVGGGGTGSTNVSIRGANGIDSVFGSFRAYGGGGGGSERNHPASENNAGGAGGKGVVILAMPLANFSNTTTGSPTESDDGTTKVLIFNGDGSYTA